MTTTTRGFAIVLCLAFGLACPGPATPTGDAGQTQDAGPGHDGGAVDAGSLDAGRADGGADAGATDAGSFDAGPTDAGSFDAGTVDAGAFDAGPPDAGTCGDGIVNVGGGEQCDRGASNGDAGCSASCQLTPGPYLTEVEPNDTQGTANSVDGYVGAVGTLSDAGDTDWYAFSVPVANASVFAALDDGFGGCPSGFDSRLSLYTSSGTLLATDTDGGNAPCSKISPHHHPAAGGLSAGTYAFQVASVSGSPQPYYVMDLAVVAPGCGDGVVAGSETCDPGPIPVSGCSNCQLTGDFIPETEPNDTPTLANPLGSHAGFIGAIKPAGDLDSFSFQVPGPASSVTLQISDGIGGCPTGFDSVLRLYDPAGNLLVTDDNGGVDLCSQISPALYTQAMNLPAGTYRARVGFNGNNNTAQLYVLTIAVQ